jgi:hypothetical protein
MIVFALAGMPDTWYEVLLMPLFFATIGIIIWLAGRNAELKDNAKPWKWAAVLPFFLALSAGWGPFFSLRDSFYRAYLEPFGKKMEIAHYAAFLLPLLAIAALAGWEFWDHKRAREEY